MFTPIRGGQAAATGQTHPASQDTPGRSDGPARASPSLQRPEGAPPSLAQAGASNPRKPYKEIGMLRNAGFGKDLNNAMAGVPVPYLSAAERQRHEVTVGTDGRLYQQQGQGQPARMDTAGAVNPPRANLYAMNKQGDVYSAPSSEVQHHSAFLAGNPGAAFGSMQVSDGRLGTVTDSSGHYAPPRDYSKQFVQEMKARNADLSQMDTQFQGRDKKDIKKAGFEFERLYPEGPKKKKY